MGQRQATWRSKDTRSDRFDEAMKLHDNERAGGRTLRVEGCEFRMDSRTSSDT